MTQRRTAVCTICSSNYLAFARTLMGSVADVHPEWERVVLITDESSGRFDPEEEDFRVVTLDELELPERRRFLFRYSILELNTAVKPWLLEALFERGYDSVFYLDPDIFVYERLREAEEALESGSLACLTPHLTGRLEDPRKPTEFDILRAGAYNLGFLGLARHPELGGFLEWWQSKTEFDCVVDFAEGLFVDQRWVDLVPGMYPDVSILRHEGYNVAYWNLAHRRVIDKGGAFRVNSEPLVFFHFSGLDPSRPASFSKHQDRFTLRSLGPSADLVRRYSARVLTNGYETCRHWSYSWGRFPDGNQIVDEIRALYRKDVAVQEAGGDDPFTLGVEYFNEPIGTDTPVVTRLMRYIWDSRLDLQQHFPDVTGRGRRDFVFWFVNRIASEHGLPDVYVTPARSSLTARAGDDSRRGSLLGPLVRTAQWMRPLARRAPPRLKAPVARWLRVGQGAPAATIRLRTSLSPGVDHSGFFPMDEHDESVGSAWMGTKALVRLPASEATELRISGEHLAEFPRMAHQSPEIKLQLGIDGRHVGMLRLTRSGSFHETLELPQPVREDAVLSLEASRGFVPAELGVSDDARELSVKIERIELGEQRVLDFALGRSAYVPRRESSGPGPGINIVGYLKSELGVGESARLCATAAQAASVPFALVDFNVGCSSRALDARWADRLTSDNPHPVNLLHVNADQVPTAHMHLGQAFFENRYNIGFWHWELPEFPDEWLGSFGPLDEVWVPSRFVQDAVSAKSPLPVVRMPHAIEFETPSGFDRKHFGLPEDEFLFLTMYDMHSIQERKNPEAVVEAYRRAFPRGGKAGLVIKLMNGGSDPERLEQLEERLGDLPGTHLIPETLSRGEVYALESACDSFVSLHRSEGFGLGLAESMYLGKPVIGTDWSANTDFMTEQNSCPVRYRLVELRKDHGPYRAGQTWADPDLDHAAWHMRRLVEDGALRRKLGAAGRQTIRTEFSPRAVGRCYQKRLAVIARML